MTERAVVHCPACGRAAELVALSNENYPAAFRCYNTAVHGDEYSFFGNDPRIDQKAALRVEGSSRSLSQLNAFKMRKE